MSSIVTAKSAWTGDIQLPTLQTLIGQRRFGFKGPVCSVRQQPISEHVRGWKRIFSDSNQRRCGVSAILVPSTNVLLFIFYLRISQKRQ